MNVKQLYEILGKYIDIGAGEWDVMFSQRDRFKTRKEWLESKMPPQSFLNFVVGEVWFAADVEFGTKSAILAPSFLFKDENKAFYFLPSEDFVNGKLDHSLGTALGKRFELGAKASKVPKKGSKKSAKTTKRSKKK